MTEILWAAVVLTAAVASCALGLALAVARRLRLLQERIAQLDPIGPDLPTRGEPVPEFEATTTTGGTVSTADLAGPDVLVLFVDGSCSSCFDVVARLREMRERALPDDPVPIAVVIGEPDERAALVEKLVPVARVVEESYDLVLASRFGVRGFPAILVVGDGVVRAASHRLDQIDVVATV